MRKYILTFMLGTTSCGLFLRTPNFDHIPMTDRYVNKPVIYCWINIGGQTSSPDSSNFCTALILFPDGNMIGHTVAIPLDKDFTLSDREKLYDQYGYDAQWGKYWIRNDSLY